jgi:hemerythrin-like domain-containing protein
MRNTLENFAVKAHTEAKGLEATFKGMHGVFKLLMEEHGEASALLSRLESQREPAERQATWSKVRSALLGHEKGEVSAVYPELERYPQTAAIATAHAENARELEHAIQRLDAVGTASEEWPALLAELRTLVSSHVEEEESEFFPVAQEALGEDQAEALEARFTAARDQALRSIR